LIISPAFCAGDIIKKSGTPLLEGCPVDDLDAPAVNLDGVAAVHLFL